MQPSAFPFPPCKPGRHPFQTILAAVLAGLLAWPPASVVAAAPQSLTLAEALSLAEANSPQLAAGEYSAAAARERGIAAGQLPDPVLRMGVDNLPINGADAFSLTADFMTMRRIGVMQEFTDSDKRDLKRRRGDVEADRELAKRDAARAALRQEVALAWLDRYFAQRAEALWRVLAREGRMQAATLEAQLPSGRASVSELRAAQMAIAQTDDQVAASEQQARASATMLSRWLGETAQRPAGPLPPMTGIGYDPADTTGLARHPQLEVLRQETLLAETDLKLAARNRVPDWSVELAYQQRGPAYSNMVSVGVSIPLPLFPGERQDRATASSQAQLALAETQYQETLRQHQSELQVGLDEWRSLQQRARSLESTLLPLADDRVSQVLASYSGGTASLTQVLDARRALAEARMQALQLQRDAARAWARLNFQFADGSSHAHDRGQEP